MPKVMWEGRFSKKLDDDANSFNASISFDKRMYADDIDGTIAHAYMLGKCSIIPYDETRKLVKCLEEIKSEIDSGKLEIDDSAEDIHMFIEAELTKRLGDIGKKIHTARSRNDQTALALRMYVYRETFEILKLAMKLVETLMKKAEEERETIMPGYTHMQRAQPVTFGHHLMAYVFMFLRDMHRIASACTRTNISPLGAGALAGTTYPIDRILSSHLAGCRDFAHNSLDAVSDRDYCVELCSDIALIMTHLSRLSEEITLWCSWEFKFIELDDAYCTGSSIMPQKKNPDIAELVRGKTGRVNGDLVTLLTMLKGLPLAYNKDLQEDKEAIFDAIDTVKSCLKIFAPLIETMRVKRDNMRKAASEGFINATDCADYLVRKSIPFRDAYKITGKLVAQCISKNCTLETLPLSEYKKASELFEEDIYHAVDLATCLKERNSEGGPSPDRFYEQFYEAKVLLSPFSKM